MQRVAVDEVEPEPDADGLHADRRDLSGVLGTTDVAVVRYALEPGERFSGALHAHVDQEELFVVLAGEATFETEDGTVHVAAGEAVHFAPGEFQSGGNDGDERLVALALGAPPDSEDVRVSRILTMDDRDVSCPECGHDHMRLGEPELVCPECGAGLELS